MSMQVSRVWWDGEKLMAEPISAAEVYNPEPVTEWLTCPKCGHKSPYSPIKAKTLAEDAERITKQARAALAEQAAQHEPSHVRDIWHPGLSPQELRETAQQEPVACVHIKDGCLVGSHRDQSTPFPDGQYGLWPIDTRPQARDPLTWEPLTDSQIMASVGRHWGGEKTSISQSRPVGQQWEQICELVRCVIRERFNTPPAQQEPVAWRHSKTHWLYDAYEDVDLADGDEWAEPLYTSPFAQRNPLSGYINEAGINANDSPHIVVEKLERAIESAYGIMGEQHG